MERYKKSNKIVVFLCLKPVWRVLRSCFDLSRMNFEAVLESLFCEVSDDLSG